MTNSYDNLTYENLRELLLNGELEHEYMSEEDYSFLLDNEIEFGDCNETVIDFCTDGLKKFDKYKDCLDLPPKNEIDLEEIVKQYQMNGLFATPEIEKVTFIVHRKSKRFIIAAFAVVASFAVITVTISAMGYDIIGLIKNALNSPDKTNSNYNGKEVVRTNDTRFYNSMNEMLKTEGINILEPSKLPHGYEFTDFRVYDFGGNFILGAYASEPNISFEVRIGAKRLIENYEYEVNGIKYNINEDDDGMYCAEWLVDEDYYTIVCGDKSVISEIIKNLKEN